MSQSVWKNDANRLLGDAALLLTLLGSACEEEPPSEGGPSSTRPHQATLRQRPKLHLTEARIWESRSACLRLAQRCLKRVPKGLKQKGDTLGP